jgi:5-carboxymethyl-2-hydroxymuconic-semialdehyde dehydrogenase
VTVPAPAARTGGVPPDVPAVLPHHIDGEAVGSLDGGTFPVLEPATNQPYADCAAGQRADVDRAVGAARRAFTAGGWPGLPARARSRILHRVADAIEARDGRLAELEAFDTGLPITQARGQARRAAENFRFFADVIVTLHEDAFAVGADQLNYVIRQPVGVAGLITPWNTPFMLATWKLAPALAAGCTVVLKPAEWSPLSATLLPEIMAEAGVPAGVVNIVHGIGEEAGAALVEHPDVPLISFTGETGTGKAIAGSAAAHLKAVSMELGGKSPCLVFADADLAAAVDAAVFQIFSLNGERCTAGSRLLVERGVYAEVVERVAARAGSVRIGPPADPRTELGALIHPEHHRRVLEYVAGGQRDGARLVAGGGRPAALPAGNYLQPTVFADVAPTHRIFQEEIFGPVLCITPFDTEAQAVELANATRYGLAAYLWTNDLSRAHRLARQVAAGMLWINSQNVRDLRTPFGGVKDSGVGREGGRHSIDFYCESRIVHVAVGRLPVPRFGTEPAAESAAESTAAAAKG